jgi:hypothetical protein
LGLEGARKANGREAGLMAALSFERMIACTHFVVMERLIYFRDPNRFFCFLEIVMYQEI